MTASYWRLRARDAIQTALVGMDLSDVAAVTKAIDAAYPFGTREMWPYKMWLLERKAALAALRPSSYEPKANRCPACGADPWMPCHEIDSAAEREPHEARIAAVGPLFGGAA